MISKLPSGFWWLKQVFDAGPRVLGAVQDGGRLQQERAVHDPQARGSTVGPTWKAGLPS